ncbi:MAG: histone deacetylase [Methanomethylovorans sp.]|uniref:histone deacetylase family protein n=1 Tax=Methanomethylovorans sp. TaxID=2758717 RepID=UPI003C76FD27
MFKEENGGVEKEDNIKETMLKLNKLIALRFNDSPEGMVRGQDDISIRVAMEEAIAPSEKENTEDNVIYAELSSDAGSSVNNIMTDQQQKQSSSRSAGKDLEHELYNKLNKLASSSFKEVLYDSCELEQDCPRPLVKSLVNEKAHLSPYCSVTDASTTVHEQAGLSGIEPKSNAILKKKENVIKSISHKEQESTVLVQKEKGGTVSDREQQVQISGKITKGINKNIGNNPPVTEDIASIMDKLDQIECGMKKNELVHAEKIDMTVAQKDLPEKVAVLYSEAHIAHFPVNTNVQDMERPERLTGAMEYLQRSGVFSKRCDLITDKYPASDQDLLLVHSAEYIKFVRSYSLSGGGFLGDSTYMTSNTFEVAGLAVGSSIQAGELVFSGRYSAAMVMTRPPGHHANADKYRGFCIFNNAAVLARYLQRKKGISKVMIIDWDAHAGDGTMEIFYDDPTVLVLSLHRDPHGFYPRRGFSSQTGEGPGVGYTVNVEMPVGAGDEDYAFVFDELVIPLLHSFSPDFVICSCGFDAYYKEQHIKLNLTSAGYHMMTKKIMSIMNGNLVLIMEGGYHKFNGHLAHVVINSLLGLPDPIADTLKTTEYERNQQKSIMKATEKKVSYVKEMLGIQE